MQKPRLIALEGIDGSGKTVQTELLVDKLKELGLRAKKWEFPNYAGFFGKEIGKILTGKAPVRVDELDPKSLALWYALDRHETALYDAEYSIEYWDYIVCNRYTLSNIAYQSARCEKADELTSWILHLEQIQLGLDCPVLTIILDIDVDVSMRNIGKKGQRDYTDTADINESSREFLSKVKERYLELEKNYHAIVSVNVMDGDNFKSKDVIHEEIMQALFKNKFLARKEIDIWQ